VVNAVAFPIPISFLDGASNFQPQLALDRLPLGEENTLARLT